MELFCSVLNFIIIACNDAICIAKIDSIIDINSILINI